MNFWTKHTKFLWKYSEIFRNYIQQIYFHPYHYIIIIYLHEMYFGLGSLVEELKFNLSSVLLDDLFSTGVFREEGCHIVDLQKMGDELRWSWTNCPTLPRRTIQQLPFGSDRLFFSTSDREITRFLSSPDAIFPGK